MILQKFQFDKKSRENGQFIFTFILLTNNTMYFDTYKQNPYGPFYRYIVK